MRRRKGAGNRAIIADEDLELERAYVERREAEGRELADLQATMRRRTGR